jgi:hypothetical protein
MIRLFTALGLPDDLRTRLIALQGGTQRRWKDGSRHKAGMTIE